MVPSGLVTTCLFAGSPTRSCPSEVKATTEGNILPEAVGPSALGTTTGRPASITAAAELVVPRSMPIIFSLADGEDDPFGPVELILDPPPRCAVALPSWPLF